MIKSKLKLYFAAPLFSEADLDFNLKIENILSDTFNVFLPQRDGGLMDSMIKGGVTVTQASRYVFNVDIKAINDADIILAVLDGRTIDEGVAIELGYAFALGKKCYGIQTTPIRLLPVGNNPMISNVLEDIFTSVDSLKLWANGFRPGCQREHDLPPKQVHN